MQKQKRVYTVLGSEDGLLGAYSNIKRAYSAANEYLQGCEENSVLDHNYAQATKRLRMYDTVMIEQDRGGCAVTIEAFILNN